MPKIRLSPSGPDITNSGGAPFDPETGARLRLTEAIMTMAGTLVIPPTTQAATAFLSRDGFGTPEADAEVLTLDNPSPALNYRAKLTFDVENAITNEIGEIHTEFDVSVDGGTNWTLQAATEHNAGPAAAGPLAMSRTMVAWVPLQLGSDLGVVSTPSPSPSLKVRARVYNDNSAAVCSIGAGSNSIHFELEECF